jgi:hypothetical protein
MILLIYRRWIRLLFGREFNLPDVLSIWDLIFSLSKGNIQTELDFSIIEFISTSMLLNISELCKNCIIKNSI